MPRPLRLRLRVRVRAVLDRMRFCCGSAPCSSAASSRDVCPGFGVHAAKGLSVHRPDGAWFALMRSTAGGAGGPGSSVPRAVRPSRSRPCTRFARPRPLPVTPLHDTSSGETTCMTQAARRVARWGGRNAQAVNRAWDQVSTLLMCAFFRCARFILCRTGLAVCAWPCGNPVKNIPCRPSYGPGSDFYRQRELIVRHQTIYRGA